MKVKNIDVNTTIEKAKKLLENDAHVSIVAKEEIESLITLVVILVKRLGLNSSNSSKPPSTDQNKNKNKTKESNKKPGGQKGHTLEMCDNPDKIKNIKLDRRTLPKGKKYTVYGYESRQVLDIKISTIVTEYRAEILTDEDGKKYTARNYFS